MKIVFDTKQNTVKVGSKTFGVDMQKEKENCILSFFNKFVKDHTLLHDFGGYEEDSMWMSYRYCIGRHTIASSMRANDIASHCYKRMSDERSIFTAFDVNREIERCMQFGCGPTWHFPITSLNRIYTSAIDIFCQFVEDFNIQSKYDLLNYRDVHVILTNNERGYKFETTTWEEWLRPQVLEICKRFYNNECLSDENAWKNFQSWMNNEDDYGQLGLQFTELTKHMPTKDHFYLNDIDDLFVWNDLVHLFDLEHHHKSILKDDSEVEWYWTYVHATEQREDGYWYQKEIGYERIRVPVDSRIGDGKKYIPEESIKEDMY